MRPEEELQQNVESGKINDPADLDVRAYQHVFSALKNPPDTRLPVSFADRVVDKVLRKKQQRESSRDMWWFGLGLFLMSVALIVALAFIGFKVKLGFLSVIGDFKWMIFLGIMLMAFFHWLDKKIITPEETFG
jgi:hypothetical protein